MKTLPNLRNSTSTTRAVVLGGYGTFGQIVARELASRGVVVTVAGRNVERAKKLAAELGPAHAGVNADVRSADDCAKVIADHDGAVNCAGPVRDFGPSLLQACLQAKCHYVDISDDRSYCRLVREHHDAFANANLAAVYGCSSLPGISLAAALTAAKRREVPPELARVTLFIGNNNPKGQGAVASASRLVGRSIDAPQGPLLGFRWRERVPLPAPFGPRSVLNFESPDYDLLPERLGVNRVRVKVGFELSLTNWAFHTFAVMAPRIGRRLLPTLGKAGEIVRGIGTSGGVVMSELFWPDGENHRVAVVAREQGQRMAALPAVYAAEQLGTENINATGASTCVDLLGAEKLLDRLVQDGCCVIPG